MFNIKKMSKKAAFLESILSELHEIKCHLANERPFEGGVGLGGIMNFLCNELEKTLNEEEEEDEEVQDEEDDEECEEGSEEEDFEHDYIAERVKNKELCEKLEKLEKKTETFEATKRAIFELQDLVMRLIKFKKIDAMEWPHVMSILRNSGVEDVDLKVLCNLEEPKKPRK